MNFALTNLLMIVNELEKKYVEKCPESAQLIIEFAGNFKYAIRKLQLERQGRGGNQN